MHVTPHDDRFEALRRRGECTFVGGAPNGHGGGRRIRGHFPRRDDPPPIRNAGDRKLPRCIRIKTTMRTLWNLLKLWKLWNRPGGRDEVTVEPTGQEHISAPRRASEGDRPFTDADDDRPNRRSTCRRSMPRDDGHADITNRQEQPPFVRCERRIIEDIDAFRCPQRLPAKPVGPKRFGRKSADDAGTLEKNARWRRVDPTVDREIAVHDGHFLPARGGDPLDRGRPVRCPAGPARMPPRNTPPVDPRKQACRDDIARHETGCHRQPGHLVTDGQGQDDHRGETAYQTDPHAMSAPRSEHEAVHENVAYRTTRAPPPAICFSTSLREAIEVSPGVVEAKAPWAAPYSTAFWGSLNARNP